MRTLKRRKRSIHEITHEINQGKNPNGKVYEKDSIQVPIKKYKVKKKKRKSAQKEPREIAVYPKQRCSYIYPKGYRCIKSAVGSSSLCKMHGGNPIKKENNIPVEKEDQYLTTGTKYDPAFHPIEFIKHRIQGLSEQEVAVVFGVSVQTMQNWAEKFESFYTAWEHGKDCYEAWWLRKARNNIDNRSINTPLYKFITMNKLGYSDKVESKSMSMNVHGVLMIPDAVSEDDWEKEEVVDA